MPIQPVIFDDEAMGALAELAEENPDLAEVVTDIGRRILNLPGVGLRESTRTYDIAFVRPRSPGIPRSRRKAFATFITPSSEGVWTPPPQQHTLLMGVKINPGTGIEDTQGMLRTRAFPAQGGGGWHDVHVAEDGSDSNAAIVIVARAYDSFDE